MRIVHAVCTDAFAGVERLTARLAAAQQDAGHEVVVVGGHPASMRRELGEGGARHVAADSVAAVARALDRLVGADVINVHMTAAEVAAAFAVRVRSVPVVSTRHFAGTRGSSSRPARWLTAATARHIRAQIAVSSYVAGHVEGSSTVVHTGVPRQAEGRGAGAREPRVLVAQRLEAEKATDVAIRAFAASGLARHGWRLQVAGSGALRPSLERLAADCEVGEAVDFLGHRSDVDALMEQAAVVVAPCDREALGLTVVEAMAHGLPVVASAAGGHLETVGATPGAALFPAGDHVAAGSILRDLALDEGRREAYGRALREVQRALFTIDTQVVGTDAVYRSVM
ncbi:hypothetical protein N865_03035 [Intrasporangium oryzae NRRL B-24470]|uniref:D-inositol 3-phosphate glycosyltransferase n=1 Tax=Intrasporangium oryzae NRRL B-24470 TaxID=1386089 RepID=W9G9H8_9MICO|nr:glycosyltransferase family 4 protein [Intrasporangium oryzae]EWT02856.1 hypothetical protein N865_03035 [Intrasporangium oryzae NRRL B-24470]